jgi:predicted aldo/keto reductase-like oxidoreductase
MTEKYLGEHMPKLGFGYMRLPLRDGSFDEEAVNGMVDEFLSHGFSYFDTAYIYEGSEEALCRSLVKRYPRERFQIATKLAVMMGMSKPEQQQAQFDISLKRLGVDFVDFYLVHGLNGEFIKIADSLDTWGYMRGVKEKGLAKHIGFSFHGTPEELDDILTKHPEMEFAQLQINYLDWENPEVQSRRLYETVRKHNTPFTIMEPTKAGLLAGGESKAAAFFKEANPDVSAASWAFRFAGGLEGLITVLSGMGNLEQIRDNAGTFKNFRPLTERERALIGEAVGIINATPRIPCTACRYCLTHCPQKIQIPAFIKIYNDLLVYKDRSSSGYSYMLNTGAKSAKPGDCAQCKECERHCPQHIEISDILAKLVAELDPVRNQFVIQTE